MLVESFDLSASGRDRFCERLALAAAKFDLPLVVLDVGAKRQEALVSVAEDSLRFREFEALGLDVQFSLGEGRFESCDLVAQFREARLGDLVLFGVCAPFIGCNGEFQDPQGFAQSFVTGRLLRLAEGVAR